MLQFMSIISEPRNSQTLASLCIFFSDDLVATLRKAKGSKVDPVATLGKAKGSKVDPVATLGKAKGLKGDKSTKCRKSGRAQKKPTVKPSQKQRAVSF